MSFERLHEIDIDGFIKSTWQSLRNSYGLIFKDTEFDEYMQQLREGIASGEFDDDWLQAAHATYLASAPLSTDYPFKRAAVLVELTQQALIRGDNHAFLALALKASAAAEGALVHAEFNSALDVPAAFRSQKASTAAKVRAEQFKHAKDHALFLIQDRRPVDDWDDLTHAAESIEKELMVFIRNNNISLTEGRIAKNLREWAENDKSFSAALNHAIAPSV